MVCSTFAQAHKASDSYLQISAADSGIKVRWDIALRDLDAALDLDANEDGRLTWGEINAAWPRIEAYALPRLRIDSCVLRATAQALERRNDGAYAVIFLESPCALAPNPVIAYSLLREVDPTHRGIVKLQRPGQPLSLQMLDPTSTAVATAPTPPIAPSGAWGFLREGIRHILTGYDHILFLLCLLLPAVMRRDTQGWRPVDRLTDALWPVVGIVSAFTVAHSLTLGLAAMHWVSLSPSLVEPAIAVTIMLAALDNIWPIFPVRRTVIAFLFGLIHGFGFANVLTELSLPTAEFIKALLQFNIGLETGQLMIVVSATALLFSLRRRTQYRAWVVSGGSSIALLIGTAWLFERTSNISVSALLSRLTT